MFLQVSTTPYGLQGSELNAPGILNLSTKGQALYIQRKCCWRVSLNPAEKINMGIETLSIMLSSSHYIHCRLLLSAKQVTQRNGWSDIFFRYTVPVVTKIRFHSEELFAPRPTPSWRTTPCRLSATEGKRPLRRPRCRWDDNIKMDLREVGCGGYGLDWADSG
jgi:hypothetical protein